VFGREQIGVMYYAMRRVTSGISMAIEKIEVLPGQQADTYQLRIVGRHSFYFPPAIRQVMFLRPNTQQILIVLIAAGMNVSSRDDMSMLRVPVCCRLPCMQLGCLQLLFFGATRWTCGF
jgi:hypothetical protein